MFNAAQPGRNQHVGDVLYTRKREDQERLRERRLGRVGGRDRDPQRGEETQKEGGGGGGRSQGQDYIISPGARQEPW